MGYSGTLDVARIAVTKDCAAEGQSLEPGSQRFSLEATQREKKCQMILRLDIQVS